MTDIIPGYLASYVESSSNTETGDKSTLKNMVEVWEDGEDLMSRRHAAL